jgi:predicted PurR-regulated permease PerM
MAGAPERISLFFGPGFLPLMILFLGGWVLYQWRWVLLPFAVGFLVAYGLRKPVARLESWSIPRVYGSFLVLFGFFVGLGGIISIVIPLVQTEANLLLTALPVYLDRLYLKALTAVGALLEHFSPQDLEHLRQGATHSFSDIVRWMGGVCTHILSGGMALATLVSLIFITPVVAFYLLKDWPRLTRALEGWMPRPYESLIKEQVSLIDQTLSAFAHGQLAISFILASYYTIILSFLDLNFAPVIGILTGILSFIPFVGFLVGAFIAFMVAIGQYATWGSIGMVAIVFALGQILESNILVPNLLGNRIGLHPVWIIFALLAGLQWAGFLGVIFAVPLAAVIGVLCRFLLSLYLKSKFYKGGGSL